jgi:uncharacterized membrane protein
VVLAVIGLVVGFSLWWVGLGKLAPIIAWLVVCACYVAWIWIRLGGCTGPETAERATLEDPGRGVTRIVLILAAVASLADLVFVLNQARGTADSLTQTGYAVLALFSVAASWALVHTVFTLKYAELYHALGGGIEFNQKLLPSYRDFAYIGFGIGMTYQIADNTITDPLIRATALRHMLLSYLFGTVVLASVINVVIGLLP